MTYSRVHTTGTYIVDHCLKQANLVITVHTHVPHTTPTLCHLREESSLWGGHTEKVLAAPVCVDCAVVTGVGRRTAEKIGNMQTHMYNICTPAHPMVYVSILYPYPCMNKGCMHAHYTTLTCRFPHGQGGIRGSLSLCRAHSGSGRSNCSEGGLEVIIHHWHACSDGCYCHDKLQQWCDRSLLLRLQISAVMLSISHSSNSTTLWPRRSSSEKKYSRTWWRPSWSKRCSTVIHCAREMLNIAADKLQQTVHIHTHCLLFVNAFHALIPALTNSTVHFDWKRNLVFSSACNPHVKGFQTGPLKVTRWAVEHSTLDSWWVDLLLNKTLQLALSEPVVVAHIVLVHLQKGFMLESYIHIILCTHRWLNIHINHRAHSSVDTQPEHN